jgi:hypothetical protein
VVPGRTTVVNVRSFGRLGLLVVGLGIGAAVASSPVASADDLDFQISFDGYDLFSTTDNSATATTVTGEYGLAIAYGDGANATAEGGTGDYALADGTDAAALVSNFGGSESNFDTAIDIGNNTGTDDGAGTGNGSYDLAIDVGNNSSNADGASAGGGNYDSAIDVGNNSGVLEFSQAGNGNYDTAVDFANNTESPAGTDAGDANNDLAAVFGVDNALVNAIESNSLYDIVTPLGSETGTAATTSGGLLAELLSLF